MWLLHKPLGNKVAGPPHPRMQFRECQKYALLHAYSNEAFTLCNHSHKVATKPAVVNIASQTLSKTVKDCSNNCCPCLHPPVQLHSGASVQPKLLLLLSSASMALLLSVASRSLIELCRACLPSCLPATVDPVSRRK